MQAYLKPRASGIMGHLIATGSRLPPSPPPLLSVLAVSERVLHDAHGLHVAVHAHRQAVLLLNTPHTPSKHPLVSPLPARCKVVPVAERPRFAALGLVGELPFLTRLELSHNVHVGNVGLMR
jgi:hypothetical protein